MNPSITSSSLIFEPLRFEALGNLGVGLEDGFAEYRPVVARADAAEERAFGRFRGTRRVTGRAAEFHLLFRAGFHIAFGFDRAGEHLFVFHFFNQGSGRGKLSSLRRLMACSIDTAVEVFVHATSTARVAVAFASRALRHELVRPAIAVGIGASDDAAIRFGVERTI